MNSIDIFNNSSIILYKKTPSKIINSIYVVIVAIILFMMFSILYKYPKFTYYRGILMKDNNDYIINVVLNERELPFNKGSSIWINRCETKIDGIVVSSIMHDELNNPYVIVKLKINIDEGIKINNNIVDVHILIRETTLANELWEKIKKGMML